MTKEEKMNLLNKIQNSTEFTTIEKAFLIQSISDAENYRAKAWQDEDIFYGD